MPRTIRRLKKIQWWNVLGEVLLIIISILIALQIDNWNSSRKERIYEKKALKEIQLSLESDVQFHLGSRVERLNEIHASCLHILSFLEGTSP